MILAFSTKINGKPTYFVEKIHSCIVQNHPELEFTLDGCDYVFNLDVLANCQPKKHTIREDKNNRWRTGTKIDFFINVRQKNMFRFAPVLPVVSDQKIDITYYNESNPTFTGDLSKIAKGYYNEVEVVIDNNKLTTKEIELLSLNDGFESVYDFFAYFDKDFTGKIIHWTNQNY